MPSNPAPHTLVLAAALAAGCGKHAEPPPPRPSNGAPFAFVVDKVVPGTPGGAHDGELDVRGYNFSDKTIDTYAVMTGFKDAGGAPLKVLPGTPFEADHGTWSMAGRVYSCEPASWCTFQLRHVDVPDKAASAVVLAWSLRVTGEDKPVFDGHARWPADQN
jgi:hypothetical protein